MYIHLAPPCGTYTRAREIPIAQWKLDLWPGMPNPQPRRTDESPARPPAESMSKTDAIKVEKGNIIANFCAEIARYCIDSNKLFSIENPTRSTILEMIDMKKTTENPAVAKIDFAACMWGVTEIRKLLFPPTPRSSKAFGNNARTRNGNIKLGA